MSKMYDGNKKGQSSFWYPTTHIGTWKPIYYVTKFLGYAPISKDSTGFFTQGSDLIFSIAAFALYVILFGMSIFTSNNFSSPLTHSKLLDMGLNVSVLLCDLTAAVIVVSNYINRFKICDISHAIQDIDGELIKLGFEMNYRKDLIRHVVHIVVVTVGQLVIVGSTIYLRQAYELINLTDSLLIVYVAVTIAYSVYMSNFIFIMVNIEKRYKAINQTLKRYFVKKPLSLTPGLGHICTKLAKLHDFLGDNVDAVNETFAFQINAPVVNAFTFTVFCIFEMFHLMKGASNVGMALITLIWNIYYTAFVIGVFYIASKLTNTGKKTAMVVHKAINLSPNSENVDKLRVFSQQLLHRPPIVTSGFFDYNWELFFGLLGSGTMYLIILIQFDT